MLVIAKAGGTQEYWPRLLASKEKQNNITVCCYLLILKRLMHSFQALREISVHVLKYPKYEDITYGKESGVCGERCGSTMPAVHASIFYSDRVDP